MRGRDDTRRKRWPWVLVGVLALMLALAGCGGTTRTVTAPPVATAPTAAQLKERATQEAAEKRVAAAQARKEAREAAAAKRAEVAKEKTEQAHEAAEHRATEARERGEREAGDRKKREHEWAPATRERFINAMVEAAPHGESTSRWRAIGECAVKELESQYTEAEVGSTSFKTAEVEAGVKCGEKTP
jgi:flagellar biosynthesis GTPase FlhF